MIAIFVIHSYYDNSKNTKQVELDQDCSLKVLKWNNYLRYILVDNVFRLKM